MRSHVGYGARPSHGKHAALLATCCRVTRECVGCMGMKARSMSVSPLRLAASGSGDRDRVERAAPPTVGPAPGGLSEPVAATATTDLSQAPPPASESASGTQPRHEPSAIRFGPFEIDRVLGSGAMSTVYAGRHPTFGRVALKVATDKQYGPHLEREHAVLHRFDHPGIPQALAFLTVVGRPTLVMTHLNAKPLSDKFTCSSARTCVGLVISLLEILDHVHRRGVVHCDVKPSNVLTGSHARLIDFGIARDIGSSSLDARGRIAGTPAYMAPEVLEGRMVDSSTDLYSLGIFLYRCLTGRVPFPTEGSLNLGTKQNLSWLPPSIVRSSLPAGLDSIIEQMLDPDPLRRPTSTTVRAALRAVAPDLDSVGGPIEHAWSDDGDSLMLTTQDLGA